YINNANNYFTLHRETGKPLGNATVQVWQNEYDYNTSKQKTIAREKLTADANGYFRLAGDKTNHRNIRLEINWEKDHLFLDDANYIYFRSETEEAKNKEEYEEDNRKAFLFTDRSLYRPGQTVYFKGIVITKDFESRQYKVIPNFKTTIELYDANSEKIDSAEVTSNEFGSYSGKFKLPENLLNGEFRIEDYETDASADFNVEEYKRPKFYVEYEPVKGSFRLNDTVRITGVAKAYAGNAIDGAMVKYRVTRNARFPYPWLFRKWGYPRSSSMEITNGEIKTGADGKFSIAFEAIPDLSIDKNFAPVFEYEINADVTDLNGETRSGETTVSVGYKALDMQITSPKGNMLPVDSIQQLFISTKNLAGAFEPAEVKVSIFPLQSPGRLIRQRYWGEPDTFVMGKEEYLKNFPYDEYKDESKKENWPKANRVYLRIDSTQPNKKIELRTPNWAPGWYVIEAVTKDKYGEEVKAIHYIQLFDSKNKLSGLQAYTWSMGNMQTANPGENANIEIGSSADELWVIQEVEKKNDVRSMKYDIRSTMYEADDKRKNAKNKTTLQAAPTPESPLPQYNFIMLNNETKVFSFPVAENDRGGFGVLHAFVKHNRFFSLNNTVTVPWDNKELNISYTTYRDKTLPGSKEQWKIKISGNKGEKVAAEILAGMYDASLDQFKPHGWNTPDIYEFYYRGNNWAGNNNFSVEQSQQKIEYRGYMAIKEKIYDDFIWGDFNPAFVRREMMQMRMTAPSMAADSFKLSEEVTVKKNLAGSVSAVTIRGMATIKSANKVLIIIDGVPFEGSRDDINPDNIINLEVLKAENAIAIYGTAGANGAILITTKSGATKKKEEQVTVRKNFHETAFFFPDLKTDADGNVEFSFTIPEALTQWKWQTLAHTKDLAFGFETKTIITQKELMVQPNAPRFMREGDAVEFSAKISNLTAKEVTGQAQLQLIDATTQQPVDGWFKNIFPVQYFTAPASQSTVVKFNIEIPYNFNQPLLYRVIAKAPLSAAGRGDGGEVSDGEENVIPVLTNRILVTESLPIQVRGSGTKNFKFEKLLNNKSESLSHQSLTVEFSSNPAWYAVQSLPYLMEYPYECAEQVFNRYYANALASMVANSSPKIKAVFETWKTADTAALMSNLQKNEELKSVLLQETPWVLQAKTESQQKKNIALLFDMVRMSKELGSSLEKLKQMQSPNGGFVWFKGGPDDRFITQYIITGLARLQHLGALNKEQKEAWNEIVKPAISYLDKKLAADYDNLIRYKVDLKKNNLSYTQIQYLYMRSFFKERPIPKASQTAYNYFLKQSQQYWLQQNRYMQGMVALAQHRYNDAVTAKAILASLKENAIKDEEKGMYWKDNTAGYYWHQAPVETQSLLIETFAEAGKDKEAVELMKLWLLRQKQTQNWKTTKATADACYALLLQGTNWLAEEPTTEIKLGSLSFTSPSGGGWEGVGYFKKTIDGKNVSSDMGKIDISLSSPTGGGQVGAWGAIYWQYFENLDQITPASTPLQLKKKLFIEKNTERGPVLQPVNEGDEIKVGDKLKVRIELRSERDMEYVHMKDMRAAGTEPVNVLSSYKWQGGLGYYESTKDASTNFFFNWLSKGTYVFEYPLFVTHAGKFSAGIANIQCMYAPEFTSHSEGINIKVK
ncbi:MAG: alpha-2-macroglobulin family protein, partial [Chitinophagaceae bacterium]|nr:alpha-2-macroglobulin family protein [Chitinophagaceae bacterium]